MPSISNEAHYRNPLVERYAGKAMIQLFSDELRFATWRKLWVALAEAQQELGIAISDKQIAEMKKHIHNIDFKKAKHYEKKFRHDVMAHVHTFGDIAPSARGIIHLGATSAFVVDNTDLIQMYEGLLLLKKSIVNVLAHLRTVILTYKKLPALGYTHFQPAQLTTVGKRATLWAHSLVLDLEEIDFLLTSLKLRGEKGTTGTSASYKDLFKNDFAATQKLEKKIAQKMGFEHVYPVCGQTYDRKVDARIANTLSQIAQSVHKITNDIRLLAAKKEIEEPFEKHQIGSSAMAYKRNPMRSERAASLAKFVMSITQSLAMVASTQWLERSLDDSANKRLSIPQAFLACDAMLILLYDITQGIVVYPEVIRHHIEEELPFIITEHILMKSVEQGGDRQQLHEIIRQHSMKAGDEVKKKGKPNDLLERLGADERIPFSLQELKRICDPSLFTGFSEQQSTHFVKTVLDPLLKKNKKMMGLDYEITV